jgi:hypothetical protein
VDELKLVLRALGLIRDDRRHGGQS